MTRPEVSIVVPLYNERASLPKFHADLIAVISKITKNSYEIIYCDDGSIDQTPQLIRDLAAKNKHLKLLRLSRNFGKEYALSAGIAEAAGHAVILVDGDGQHPVKLIPKFIKAWKGGARVVVGLRTSGDANFLKKASSKLFHELLNRLTYQKLRSGSTDFRLIDQSVKEAFLTLRENNRLTRGLIDWLGFEPVYISFQASPRLAGPATYGRRQRIRLAADSFMSLTPKPLYLFGYVGMVSASLSCILGIAVITEQLMLGDPLHWKFTGTAMLGLLIIFLTGIMLISQAILSLYISQILRQSQQRPLYVIDYQNSIGIQKHD